MIGFASKLKTTFDIGVVGIMYDLDILKQLIDPVTKSSSKIHSPEDIGYYIFDIESNMVL